jgi:hypothetical protein
MFFQSRVVFLMSVCWTSGMSDPPALSVEVKAKAAKAYLEKDVVPILTQALAKMCVEEPEDPYMWLAKVGIRDRFRHPFS